MSIYYCIERVRLNIYNFLSFFFFFIIFDRYLFQAKCLFLLWLPWFLCMQRPGKDISFKAIRSRYTDRRGMELRERSSRSLLANVLDIGTVIISSVLFVSFSPELYCDSGTRLLWAEQIGKRSDITESGCAVTL